MGVPLVAGGGIGAVVLALVVMFLGGDPNTVLQQGAPAGQTQEGTVGTPQDEGGDFVAGVLGDTEDTWNTIFREQLGREYEEPRLVLFSDMVQSECGMGQAASGPFYCPLDRRVYIDLAFYRQLREQFGAPGDFAQAYVIAHEVGHHVQTLLGISQQVHSARAQTSREEGNELSVRQELQADCFSGVWANHAQRYRNVLEPGDLEEALNAAASIGDDRLTRGRVSPESFTHGTSEQRVRWFRTGFEAGDIRRCDTFDASSL